MPDQPGKGPSSASPLSAEDADRLAESFTPFWEEEGGDSLVLPAADVQPVVAAPAPFAPVVAGQPIARPTNKQTLVGLTPFMMGQSAARPVPSSSTVEPTPSAVATPRAFPAAPLEPISRTTQPLATPGALPTASDTATRPLPSAQAAEPPTVPRTQPFPAIESHATDTPPGPLFAVQRPPAVTKTHPLPATVPAPELGPPPGPVATPPTETTQPLAATPVAAAPRPSPDSAEPATSAATTASSVVITQPLPAIAGTEAAPAASAPFRGVHHQTLLGLPILESPARPVSVLPATPTVGAPALTDAQQGSPLVPGYARAYTPKDGPGTPAVVIASDVQASAEDPRLRANPVHSLSGAPLVLPSLDAADDDLELYAPKKGKGALIASAALGAILIIGLIAYEALSRGGAPEAAVAPAEPPKVSTTAATRTAAAPNAPPTPEPGISGVSRALPSPEKAVRTQPSVVKKPSAAPKLKPGRFPAAASPPRQATRPSPEPGAAPASKGVIVRDAPF